MKFNDNMASHCHTLRGLDPATKSREQQSLQPVLRLRPSCAGITFEGRVAFVMPKKFTQDEFEINFWSRIKIAGLEECWEWIGAKNACGYGILNWGLAHRMSYKLAKGEIPDGINVLHRCDNRPCCNPIHLFLGTQADNIADCVSKNRQGAPRGESHHAAKITREDVLEIRRLANGTASYNEELAARFGIAPVTVYQIVRRMCWKHV